MRVAILAGGLERDSDYCLRQLHGADRTICADSGYRTARALGFRPDLVVGDLDSLTPAEVEQLLESGIPVERALPDKDQSDLELAIDAARRWGAAEVILLGVLEGRPDHMLFNLISCLCYCHELELIVQVGASTCEAFLIASSRDILDRQGWTCSLLSLAAESRDVRLRGFRYELSGESLFRHRTRGLSNLIEAPLARVEVGEGLLLAVLVPPGSDTTD